MARLGQHLLHALLAVSTKQSKPQHQYINRGAHTTCIQDANWAIGSGCCHAQKMDPLSQRLTFLQSCFPEPRYTPNMEQFPLFPFSHTLSFSNHSPLAKSFMPDPCQKVSLFFNMNQTPSFVKDLGQQMNLLLHTRVFFYFVVTKFVHTFPFKMHSSFFKRDFGRLIKRIMS